MDHSSLDATELRRSSRPEVLWDPLEYPPEVELSQGLEIPYDGLEHYGEEQPESPVRLKTGLSWRWLSYIALIFAAIISGSLGGALSKWSSTLSLPTPTASQASSPQPSASTATGSSMSQTILRNTSITSTTCPNGDRWIFFQDITGSIRQAQFPSDVGTWSVASNGTIPSAPRAGTPLSATCIEVPLSSSQTSSYFVGPGIWIPVIYLDASNAIRAAVLSAESWQDYPTWPTLFTSANNTKLSASLILEPSISEGRTMNATHFISTVLCQSTNGSIVMVNVYPSLQKNSYFHTDPPINPNIISTFVNSSADEAQVYRVYTTAKLRACLPSSSQPVMLRFARCDKVERERVDVGLYRIRPNHGHCRCKGLGSKIGM